VEQAEAPQPNTNFFDDPALCCRIKLTLTGAAAVRHFIAVPRQLRDITRGHS
jgi:hypothetical protein